MHKLTQQKILKSAIHIANPVISTIWTFGESTKLLKSQLWGRFSQ